MCFLAMSVDMVTEELRILAVGTKTCSPVSVMESFRLGCDIKYIAFLHLSASRSKCATTVLSQYTTEALVSLSSIFMILAPHLSKPLVVGWHLRHSQTDPWFRITVVSKEEICSTVGL